MPTVLVVEDNPISLKLLRVTLQGEGYRVLEAPDGASALSHMARGLPDLILQDLFLPDMDGFELVHRLREFPGAKSVPILALSGFLARLEAARATHIGFAACLVKPIEPSRLVEIVQSYLPPNPELRQNLGEGHHILVVDDNHVQLKLARLQMESQGFQVDVASNARAALEALNSNPPEAVLSDILMPDMDGFDLCRTLRQNPLFRHIPIVFFSSHCLEAADQALAHRAGANALIPRTPGLEEAAEAVIRAIQMGPPPPPVEPLESIRVEHLLRMAEQLERQASPQRPQEAMHIQGAQLAILTSACARLTSRSDQAPNLSEVLGTSLDAAGISRGALYLIDAHGQPKLHQSIGYDPTLQSSLKTFFDHQDFLMECANRGQVLSFPSERDESILALAGVASGLLVPVAYGGEAYGVLFLGAERTDLLGSDPVAFASALAGILAQALALTSAFSRLARSEERYRRIVESTTEGVWTIDSDHRTTFVNQRASDMLGYPIGEILGMPISTFMDEGQFEHAKASTTGIRGSRETKLKRRDGTELWVNISAAPLMESDGGSSGAMALVSDRTEEKKMQERDRQRTAELEAEVRERRKAEEEVGRLNAELEQRVVDRTTQLTEANQELEAYSYTISHDLRAPLRHILAFAHLLREGAGPALTEGSMKYLSKIDDSAKRMVVMIEDLLAFSHIGRSQMRLTPVNMKELVESAMKELALDTQDRAIEWHIGPLPQIVGDPSLLKQVWVNLLTNAIKYSRNSRPSRIKVIAQQRENEVEFEVTDNGAGFDMKHVDKLFGVFQRLHRESEFEGTGIGLANVRRIVHRHGGRTWAEGEVNRGATIHFTLPMGQE